jgi:hypothetical protein
MKAHWSEKLNAMGACADAVEWAHTQPSLAVAWRECERGDWMLWLAGRLIGQSGSMAHRRVVKAAVSCARLALPIWKAKHPTDDRPRLAIVAAERWAKAPSEANRKAAYAAYAAAAAYAAYAAAAAAAAAYAAYAYAAYAAAAAAAAYAAAAYAAADAADAASARQRSLARSAAIVRKVISCPTLRRT